MATLGGYELERPLGAGGSGTVWRARRPGAVRQTVALKRLPPGASPRDLDRLRHEAAVLADLDHPHVVRVIELVEDRDGAAIAMAYAPGGSLADLLAERGRLEPGEVVAVAAPVARALASAHRRGVLHGDVKPANILFTSDGEPLLSDFGVARRLAAPVSGDTSVGGTAEYLAPELLDGAEPDPRADVYALGVVCFEALTGAPPYAGPTPLAVVRAADRGAHPPLDGVPPALAAAVEAAIARDPNARPAGGDELAAALLAAAPADDVRLPGPAAPAAPADPAFRGTRTFGPRPPRRRQLPPARTLVPLAVLAGVLAVAVAATVVVRGGDDSPTADCAAEPTPAVPAGGELVTGDFDGDGCPSSAVWAGNVLEASVAAGDAAPRRYSLGQPGDVLRVGDWDCDGADTPALYRPSTGEVLYYDAWAQPGAPLSSRAPEATGRPNGRPEVTQGDDGCDRIEVRPAG